ncbi:hypothetical protein L1887_44386 [Cichorium endivia]|nr:hypothetical protein L1887_44386 [Cichorium endivia]
MVTKTTTDPLDIADIKNISELSTVHPIAADRDETTMSKQPSHGRLDCCLRWLLSASLEHMKSKGFRMKKKGIGSKGCCLAGEATDPKRRQKWGIEGV